MLICLLTSPESGEQNRLLAWQMTSRWPSMGTSMRRRSHQDQEQLEENEVLQPAVGHLETSSGTLGSLCRQFQRRLPLRAVSLNLGTGSSWKRLETPEPGQQGLQAAARSAKNALGAMSQVMLTMSRYGGFPWCLTTAALRKPQEYSFHENKDFDLFIAVASAPQIVPGT